MRCMKVSAFVLTLVLALVACSSPPEPETDALVTIGGTELGGGELRYLITTVAGEYPEEIDWDGTLNELPARRYFLEEALSMAVSSHVTAAKADELGFTLTDEEQGEIDWEIALEAEYRGGREAFAAWLSESELTEALYRFYSYEIPFLQEKMIIGLFGDGCEYEPGEQAERDYYENNYLTVSYIYISGTDDYGEALIGKELQTQRSIADALRRQATGGEDFTQMVETHGQDYLMSLSPGGRTISHGELANEAETALANLVEGEISEVVAADGGFYIMKRLPIDWNWFTQNREDVWYLCAEDAFYTLLSEWSGTVDTEVNDAYYELDPLEWLAVG